jgi:uncharacterized protein DUF3221
MRDEVPKDLLLTPTQSKVLAPEQSASFAFICGRRRPLLLQFLRQAAAICGCLLPLTAILLACAPSTPRAPAGPPSIEGRVTAVDRAGERIGSIRVEANPSESSGSDKAVVRITQGTAIVRADSAPADFNALSSGQWVRVWFTGPVRESYPVQADAARVQIDSTR